MRRLVPILTALSLPLSAAADMTPEAFEAFTQGKTLYYSVDGVDYGVERYLPDRRVQWSFLDGDCKDGTWYPQNGQICFAYEGWDDHQCWQFSQSQGGLIAEFMGETEGQPVYRADERETPMLCLGPKVGV